MRELPPGWAWTTLGEIAAARVDSDGPHTEVFTYLDITSIDAGKKRVFEPKQISKSEAPSRARQNVERGDVMVSLTRPNLNAVAMVGAEYDGAIASTAFHVLRAMEVEPAWLFYIAQTNQFIVEMCSRVQGALYPAIRSADVLQYPVPVAPLPEQHRIVAEIEKHLTRLEAATASLRQAKANLRRLRTSVVSSTLRWNGWPEVPLGRVIERIEAGKNFRCEERPPMPGEFGVVKVSAVSWGRFDEQASKTCSDPERFVAAHVIRPGDFLMSRANTAELVGRCVIAGQITRQLMLSDKILRLILHRDVEPGWLLYTLGSRQGRQQIESRSTGNQESMRNISQKSIQAIEIPLPGRDEQAALVAEIERSLSLADSADRAIELSARRAGRLRQAILKKAFEGKLVPQDPNDEPASVLLERIRATRAHAPAAKRRRAMRQAP